MDETNKRPLRILALYMDPSATDQKSAAMGSLPNRAIQLFLFDLQLVWKRWGVERVTTTWNSLGNECPCLYISNQTLTADDVKPMMSHYGMIGEFVE